MNVDPERLEHLARQIEFVVTRLIQAAQPILVARQQENQHWEDPILGPGEVANWNTVENAIPGIYRELESLIDEARREYFASILESPPE